jgi:hypothetical protein
MFMLLSTSPNGLPDFFLQHTIIFEQTKITSLPSQRLPHTGRQLTRAKHTLLFALIRLVKEAAWRRRSSANTPAWRGQFLADTGFFPV